MTQSPWVTEIRPYVSTAKQGRKRLYGQGLAWLVKPSPLHEGQERAGRKAGPCFFSHR